MKDTIKPVDGTKFEIHPEKPKKKMTVLIQPKKTIAVHSKGRGVIPLKQYGIGVNFLPFPSSGITVTVDSSTFIDLRNDGSLDVREVK